MLRRTHTMGTIAQQELLVKESLFQFITKHVPMVDISGIDDIVLSYVTSILEEVSNDPTFDIEGFKEMMDAYLPPFGSIDTDSVYSWIFELEAELSRVANDSSDSVDGNESASSDKISLSMQSLSEMLPVVTKNNRSHSNSESSDSTGTDGAHAQSTQVIITADDAELYEQCAILHELFPNSCSMEIKHCVSIANCELEYAAQILLHRREIGQSLMIGTTLTGINKQKQIDDNELKNRIIARYSYVDNNSDQKEHKPLAPKNEPRKMVRYRDNKIVSLKGERYTEVPKTGADDEQLKKPKKQHCP